MITTNDLEHLECLEVRVFSYWLMVADIGPLEKYKKYDGRLCEEVAHVEKYNDIEIIEHGWQIIGTNRIIEYGWTVPTDAKITQEQL